MATLAAEIPLSDEALAARRKWRWAAILLQVEAFGAVMLGAFFLIRSTAVVSPAPSLMAFTAAAVLFPLASAIERGNRRAALALVVLYIFRVSNTVFAPASLYASLALLMPIEIFIYGRAIIAMGKPGAPPPEPSSRTRNASLLVTVLPILVAASLFSKGSQQHLRAAVYGTDAEALRTAHTLGWVLALLGIGLVLLHRTPAWLPRALERIPRAIPTPKISVKLPWTLQARLDLTIGAVTLIVSVWALDWILDRMEGAMLMAGVLIYPLIALMCIPLGFVWIGIGIAEIKGKPWVKTLRVVAAFPLLFVAVLSIPMIGSYLKGLLLVIYGP